MSNALPAMICTICLVKHPTSRQCLSRLIRQQIHPRVGRGPSLKVLGRWCHGSYTIRLLTQFTPRQCLSRRAARPHWPENKTSNLLEEGREGVACLREQPPTGRQPMRGYSSPSCRRQVQQKTTPLAASPSLHPPSARVEQPLCSSPLCGNEKPRTLRMWPVGTLYSLHV